MFENTIKFIQEIYKSNKFIPLHEPRFFGNEKKYINEWNGDNNLVLVTHYVTIQEVLNITPSSGELIIADKNFNILARQNF